MMRNFFVLALLVTWLGCLGIGQVIAQETPAETLVSSPVVEIQVQPSLTAEINDLKLQYRAELEQYRDLERQSTIANLQYTQLQTLVSLETAVTTLKKAMESRVRVLELYLRLLKLELTNATGVELSSKQSLLSKLDLSLTELASHQAQLAQANDRESLLEVSASFGLLGSELQVIAYQTQAQLTISRLQTVYDKVQSVKEEVKQQTADQTPLLQQPARERAFIETDRNLNEVRDQLLKLQATTGQQEFSQNSYTGLLQTADSVYAGLAQSLNFLSELAGLTTNDG